MKTYAFIGSDKNAGKTTVFNVIYRTMKHNYPDSGPICLTSTGINGETIDHFAGHVKPEITCFENTFFITTPRCITHNVSHNVSHMDDIETLAEFTPPSVNQTFVLARAKKEIQIVLEGPNCKADLLAVKQAVYARWPDCRFLIDGSIDRQFLAHPQICDLFYFALLLSSRGKQIEKANNLLIPLNFPVVAFDIAKVLCQMKIKETRSMVFSPEYQVYYHGREIPFLDPTLLTILENSRKAPCFLYLNGALCRALYNHLAKFEQLTIILDNFTLYQNISVQNSTVSKFFPAIFLLWPIKVAGIFINDQCHDPKIIDRLPIPAHIDCFDLFDQNLQQMHAHIAETLEVNHSITQMQSNN